MTILEDRALRVLLVTPDYPPAHGGIQSLLHRITRAMPNAETRVIAPSHPDAVGFDRSQQQIITRVGTFGSRPAIRNAVFNVAAFLQAPRWKPDVVLSGHVVSGPATVMLARRFDVASVIYTHYKEIIGRPGITAWSIRNSDSGIAVSNYARGKIADIFGGTLPTPVTVIHPGAELPELASRKPAARPTIVTTARLRDWYKGHDKIIEALPAVLKAVPDAQWVVIGDGQLRSELEARAQKLNVGESVQFLGAVTDEVRDNWLAAAHVFALPARYPKNEIGGEGFPVVYFEAAGRGLPAIAGNMGGPSEAVLDGRTGLLVDAESSTEIARALITLLSNTEYAEMLGAQARERVAREFRWEHVGAQLEALLRQVAAARQKQ